MKRIFLMWSEVATKLLLDVAGKFAQQMDSGGVSILVELE